MSYDESDPRNAKARQQMIAEAQRRNKSRFQQQRARPMDYERDCSWENTNFENDKDD